MEHESNGNDNNDYTDTNLDDGNTLPMDTTSSEEVKEELAPSDQTVPQQALPILHLPVNKFLKDDNNVLNDDEAKNQFFNECNGLDNSETTMANTAIMWSTEPHQVTIKTDLIYSEGYPIRPNTAMHLDDLIKFANTMGIIINLEYTNNLLSNDDGILSRFENLSKGTLIKLKNEISFVPAEKLFNNDGILIAAPIIGASRVDMAIRPNKQSNNNLENFYIMHSPIRNSNLSIEDIRCANTIVKIRGCPLGIRKSDEINQVNAETINFFAIVTNFLTTCLASDKYLLENFEILFKKVLIKKGIYNNYDGKSEVVENRVEEMMLQVILPRTGSSQDQRVRRSAFLKLLGIAAEAESFPVAVSWRNHNFDMIANNYEFKNTKVSNITQQPRLLTEFPYLRPETTIHQILNSMKTSNYDILVKEIVGIYLIKGTGRGNDGNIKCNRGVIAWKSNFFLLIAPKKCVNYK